MKKLFFILLITHFSLIIAKSQWLQQTVPVNKPITGIKFIDSLKGWACTSAGSSGLNYCYIIATTNGGNNWFIQDSTFNAIYGAISIINNNIAYCGGYDFSTNTANLKKTTNSGTNWILIPTPTNMAIGDMVFLNQDSGWICSNNVGADVRTTTNGGLNWIVRTSGFAQQTQRIFFLNYNTGYCGASYLLYKTTNAGLNWILINNFSDNIDALFFTDSLRGWTGFQGRVRYTSNGGLNWTTQYLQPFNISITDIFTTDNQIVYACVPIGFGKIHKTTDGGLSWGLQDVPTGSLKMSFLDTSKGWTGKLGISKTTNGGGPIFYTGFVGNSNKTPERFTLHQNYPNPFNPYTTIKLDLPKASTIRLLICDILGRVLYTIANQYLQAGTYEFNWDALDYTSGVYLYRLSSENYTETRKMLLLK